jgi:hypothetical protein
VSAISTPALDAAWLISLSERVPVFLSRLESGGQKGRYLPCLSGATEVGRKMALGWSCFALKLHHMLDGWSSLPEQERTAWLSFIRGFQRSDEEAAFIDEPEITYLEKHGPWRERLKSLIGRAPAIRHSRSIVLAETKQAIATLAEVGEKPERPFRGFPSTPEGVRAWFEAQDWSRPWGAGGQAAGLVVFIKTEAPNFLAERDVAELLQTCRDFYTGLANRESGAYFRGTPPKHGEMINGAMKVLMALEWLDVRPHYTDELVKTCLEHPPLDRGCHLVDAIYVLHQCTRGEPTAAVRQYCLEVLEGIRHHANEDGGFSFYRGKAQTNYYGVPVSRGLAESDIQGTCLLVWALAMIWKMLAPETAAWRVMKP